MAQAARLASRLQRELTMLHSDPPPGVSAWPCHQHLLTHIQAQIHGPQGTVYSNGIFKLDIQVPERYPFEPPNIRFVTPVYHPNIDNGGRICLDILNLPPKGAWRPSLNLSTLLASIGLLLAEPNPDDGLMVEITAEYKHDRSSFDRKARKWTELYAGQDQVTTELNEPNTSSRPETNQNLASVGCNSREPLQVASSKGPEDIIAKCDSLSQPLRSGLSLSKRLALDRGTPCLQQNKPASSNVSHINNNQVQYAVNNTIHEPVNNNQVQHAVNNTIHEPVNNNQVQHAVNDTIHEPVNNNQVQHAVNDTIHEPVNNNHVQYAVNGTIHEPGKEKGYFCLPSRTKSLKLARAKPDSHSMTSQQNIQSIPVKKWTSPPIIIPDAIPTVVVSDSGSDSELSDEGFTFSLTQRSLSNKRKAGSKLR